MSSPVVYQVRDQAQPGTPIHIDDAREGSVHTRISPACKEVGISCEIDLLRIIIRYLDGQWMRSRLQQRLARGPEHESSGA